MVTYQEMGRTDDVSLFIGDKTIEGKFTSLRVDKKTLPKGIYAYDFREGDNGDFCTIEPNVLINHGGTFIVTSSIDFGEKGYLECGTDCDYSF